MEQAMSLLVVGSVAYDSITSPFGTVNDALGGSAVFFSLAAARFTTPRIVAVVGADFRPEHTALLQDAGADTAGLVREAAGKTFRWCGRYHEDGINRTTLSTHLNVFEHFNPEIPAAFRDSATVFLANIHPALQLRVLDQVDTPRFVAADTMDLWIDTEPAALRQVLRRVDALLVNDSEARALSGEHLMVRAARAIRAMGPRVVVIKRGEHGALLFSGDDDVCYMPALLLDRVVDPTGAGDTFAGGFMGFLDYRGDAEPESLRQAMAVGTVMASFTVQAFSTDALGRATPEEIRTRLATLNAMTTFADPGLPIGP